MADEDLQTELVRQAAAGDAAALTTLLVDSRPELCERLRRRIPPDLGGALDADDVVQQTHVEVFQHIHALNPASADAFERWVATIALRKLRDAIRRRRTLKRGGEGVVVGQQGVEDSMIALLDGLEAPGNTPSRSVARWEAVAAVQDALTRLPEDYELAIRLVCLEGRSAAQAAERMRRTERAIHNLCYKAKLQLREILQSDARFFSRP